MVYATYVYLVMLVLGLGLFQFWEFREIQAQMYCVPTHRRATKLKGQETMKSPLGS